jgi:hypothetical protein
MGGAIGFGYCVVRILLEFCESWFLREIQTCVSGFMFFLVLLVASTNVVILRL